MNNIYLIVGCSGSGKTTIANILEQKYGLKSIQSYTTRKPRFKSEKGHIFVSDEEFDNLKDIVAYTEFCGNRYCATADQLDNNDIYIIDPKGIDVLKYTYKGNKSFKVIYISSDVSTRFTRMKQREMKSGKNYVAALESALGRIINDASEFNLYINGVAPYDFAVENNHNSNRKKVAQAVYEYMKQSEKLND